MFEANTVPPSSARTATSGSASAPSPEAETRTSKALVPSEATRYQSSSRGSAKVPATAPPRGMSRASWKEPSGSPEARREKRPTVKSLPISGNPARTWTVAATRSPPGESSSRIAGRKSTGAPDHHEE